MSLFARVQEKFGFTRTEITVILFLSGTFLFGLAIRQYRHAAPAGDAPQAAFDYSRSDSAFAALTRAVHVRDSLTTRSSARQSEGGKRDLDPHSIDINTATRAQLMELPGIGGQYADRILSYRKAHGPFSSVEDLLNVKGIGRKRLERIRGFVRPPKNAAGPS